MALNDAVDNLRGTFEGMNDRERRLLTAAACVFFITLFGIPLFLMRDKVASLEDENEEIQRIVKDFGRSRPRLLALKAERQAVERLYAKRTPSLGTFLEKKAQKKALGGLEVSDQPTLSMGKYTRRSVRATIPRAPLRPFIEMLADIKNSGHPVSISRVRIDRPRSGDDYSVQFSVNAYDKDETAKETTSK